MWCVRIYMEGFAVCIFCDFNCFFLSFLTMHLLFCSVRLSVKTQFIWIMKMFVYVATYLVTLIVTSFTCHKTETYLTNNALCVETLTTTFY